MPTDRENDSEKQAEWHPEPAESFAIDYGSREDIRKGMPSIGFREIARNTVNEETVIIHGVSVTGDGTTIEMTVRKGDNYKSPKELAAADAEKQKSK